MVCVCVCACVKCSIALHYEVYFSSSNHNIETHQVRKIDVLRCSIFIYKHKYSRLELKKKNLENTALQPGKTPFSEILLLAK